jgi:alpha-amylase
MSKPGITFYFHVHQPWRVRNYTVFDTGTNHQYFNAADESDQNNAKVFQKVADKSYRPMNRLLQKLLDEQPDFKFSLSITGTFLEQCEAWAPDVVDDFKRLAASGRVEIVAETYYHSLAFFYSIPEFERQVEIHTQKVQQLFGQTPTAFRNTELAYYDALGQWADKKGYKAVLAEGWDPILAGRSPNHVYQPPETTDVKLLLKNYRLSDDVAFRFGNRDWQDYPLDADKYEQWVSSSLQQGPLINLFMDYETFGEHQWADTGIFNFFEAFTKKWSEREDTTFYTVSEAAEAFAPSDVVSMPHTVTWADTERDLTAWLGNGMQQDALRYIYELEHDVMRSGDIDLISDWRKLQTSDHAYYMCTKWFKDGDVHAYFSPYDSPYDAFLYFINAVRDVRYRLMAHHHIGGGHG